MKLQHVIRRDVVAFARPDRRIGAWAASHVDQPGPRRRQEAVGQFQRPCQLEAGAQRPYVATTEQVWALHDAMDEHLRPAILRGALAGLRTAETCALRVVDVDFMRGIVAPAIQWPAEPLKSECSKTPVPIPQELALVLAAGVKKHVGETVVADELRQACSPWELQRAHQVGDRQREDAVEDVDADFGVGPVVHRAEGDDVGVSHLPET